MKILITGATGFVGVNLVKHLSNDHDICVFVRNKDRAIRLFDNVGIAVGDISDINSLNEAFKHGNFDAVIHVAGVIKANDLEKLYRVNRYGTKNVANVAYNSGVQKFIYISSLAARGPDGFDHPVSHYGNSKRLGELELLKYPFKNTIIIRPPIIFGPYDRGLLPLFKLAKFGLIPVVNRTYSFLYVKELCKVVELSILNKIPGFSFVYASSFTCNFFSFSDMLAKSSEKKCIKVKLPMALLEFASLFNFKNIAFGKDKLREIIPKAWTCTNETASQLLGFNSNCDPFLCIKKTYDWYLNYGWI